MLLFKERFSSKWLKLVSFGFFLSVMWLIFDLCLLRRMILSFAAAVVQGRRSEPKTHRQAAVENALNQDPRDVVNPSYLMLDSRNSNLPNLGAQTQDSRESNL